MPAAKVSHLSPKEREKGAPSSELQSISDAGDERTAYEKVLYNLHHDTKWVKEVSLGRRVGFYRFRGELGQGNFSTVKLAHHQLTKDKVAVKVIEKTKLDQKTQRMLSREISNMDIVAHPNIIRLFEVVETLSRIHLVLEFAPGGDVFNRVSTEGRITENEAAPIFSQVLSAIVYLHSISIIHRDIKAENVFMVTYKRVKLGDFGFSTRVSKLKEQLSTFCGSPPYAAPELYKDESYQGPAVDVWALGVLLFFLLTADMPFKASTVAGLKRQILGGSLCIPSYLSNEAIDLIMQLLVQSPQERLPPHEIGSHEWFHSKDIVVRTPLPSHLTFPRPADCQETLTPEEEMTFKQLDRWGVSRRNLTQAAEQGARSALMATYRILLHRLFHADDPEAALWGQHLNAEGQSRTATPEPGSQAESRSNSTRKPKFKLRNGFTRSHSSKSRTCVVL